MLLIIWHGFSKNTITRSSNGWILYAYSSKSKSLSPSRCEVVNPKWEHSFYNDISLLLREKKSIFILFVCLLYFSTVCSSSHYFLSLYIVFLNLLHIHLALFSLNTGFGFLSCSSFNVERRDTGRRKEKGVCRQQILQLQRGK